MARAWVNLQVPCVARQPRPATCAGAERPNAPNTGNEEPGLNVCSTAMRRILTRHVLFGASLVLLVEEWLWTSTTHALARLSRFALIAGLERWIGAQPPRVALVLLATPVLAIVPFKVLAIALMYAGQAALGVALLVADKLVATALFARVWQLTEPAVSRIEVVRRLRDEFLRLRSALHAWLDAQPAYIELRAIVRRHIAALRRQRDAVRRFRRWREAGRKRTAVAGDPSSAAAGISPDR